MPNVTSHQPGSLLRILFEQFRSKVDTAVQFTIDSNDEILHDKSEAADTLSGDLWWNLLQLDESFHIGSHLSVFQRVALSDWPSVVTLFVAKFDQFRHDPTYYSTACPREQTGSAAKLLIYLRVFAALLSRFGVDSLPAQSRKVLNQMCRDKARLPPTGLGTPVEATPSPQIVGRPDLADRVRAETEYYWALCREIVFLLNDTLAAIFAAIHSLTPVEVMQEVVDALAPSAPSAFERRRRSTSSPSISRPRAGSGGFGINASVEPPAESFVVSATLASKDGASAGPSAVSAHGWLSGNNSYNPQDRHFGGYQQSQVLLVYLARHLRFDLTDDVFVRRQLCAYLQALLNSLDDATHRDLQFAEIHALQGALQQIDFQITPTKDGSWGILALHAERAKTLCLSLAREAGELKAASLQLIATVIMHSREIPFRSLFYDFVRKRAVRHLDQPRKVYHSLEILRTVVQGGNPANDGALRCSQLIFNTRARQVLSTLFQSRSETTKLPHGAGAGSDGDDEGDGDFHVPAVRGGRIDSAEVDAKFSIDSMGSLRAGHQRVVPDQLVTANLRMRRNLNQHSHPNHKLATKDATPQSAALSSYLAEVSAWVSTRRPVKALQRTRLVEPMSKLVSDIFFQIAAHDLSFFKQRVFAEVFFTSSSSHQGIKSTVGRRSHTVHTHTVKVLTKNLMVFRGAVNALRRVADPGTRFCTTKALGDLNGAQCSFRGGATGGNFPSIWELPTNQSAVDPEQQQRLVADVLVQGTAVANSVRETVQAIILELQGRDYFDYAYECCGVNVNRSTSGTGTGTGTGTSFGSGSTGSGHGTGGTGDGALPNEDSGNDYDALVFSHYDDPIPPHSRFGHTPERELVATQKKRWWFRLQALLRQRDKAPGSYKGDLAALLDTLVDMEKLKACMFCPSSEICAMRKNHQRIRANLASGSSAFPSTDSACMSPIHAWIMAKETPKKPRTSNGSRGPKGNSGTSSGKATHTATPHQKIMKLLPQIEFLYFPHWRLANAVSHTLQKIALESDSVIVQACVIETFVKSISRHALRSDVQKVIAAANILAAIILRLPSVVEAHPGKATPSNAGTTPRRRPQTVLGRCKWYFRVEALCLTLLTHHKSAIRDVAFHLAAALAKDGNSTEWARFTSKIGSPRSSHSSTPRSSHHGVGNERFVPDDRTVRGHAAVTLWNVLCDTDDIIISRAKARLRRHCAVHKRRDISKQLSSKTLRQLSDETSPSVPSSVDEIIDGSDKIWSMVRIEIMKSCLRHLNRRTIRHARTQLWSWMASVKVNCYNFSDLRHFHSLASALAQEHASLYGGSTVEGTSATGTDADKTSDGLFYVFRQIAGHAGTFFALTTSLYSLYEVPTPVMPRLRQNIATGGKISNTPQHSPSPSKGGLKGSRISRQNTNDSLDPNDHHIGVDNPIQGDLTDHDTVLQFLFRDLLRALLESAAEHRVVELQWTRHAFECSFADATGVKLKNRDLLPSNTCISGLELEHIRDSLRQRLPPPRRLHHHSLLGKAETQSAPTADPAYYNATYALYWQGLFHEILMSIDRSANGLLLQKVLKWGSPGTSAQQLNANLRRVGGKSALKLGAGGWKWESSLMDMRNVFGVGARGGNSSSSEVRNFPTLTVATGSTIIGIEGTLDAYNIRLSSSQGTSPSPKSNRRIPQQHYAILGERAVAETLMRFVLSYTQTREFICDFFRSPVSSPTSAKTKVYHSQSTSSKTTSPNSVDADDKLEFENSSRRSAEAVVRMNGDFAALDKFLLEHAWQRLPQTAAVPKANRRFNETSTGDYVIDAADLRYSIELVTTLAALALRHQLAPRKRHSNSRDLKGSTTPRENRGVATSAGGISTSQMKGRPRDNSRRTELQNWSFRTRSNVWWRISSCRRCVVAGLQVDSTTPIAVPQRHLRDFCFNGTTGNVMQHDDRAASVTLQTCLPIPASSGTNQPSFSLLKQPTMTIPSSLGSESTQASLLDLARQRHIFVHIHAYNALAHFQFALIAATQSVVQIGSVRPISEPLPQSTKLEVAADLCWILSAETHGHRNMLAPYIRSNWTAVDVLITVFYLYLAKASHNSNFRAHAAEILRANDILPSASSGPPGKSSQVMQQRHADIFDLFVVADSPFEIFSFVSSSPWLPTNDSFLRREGSAQRLPVGQALLQRSMSQRLRLQTGQPQVDFDTWTFGRAVVDEAAVEQHFSRSSEYMAPSSFSRTLYQEYFPSATNRKTRERLRNENDCVFPQSVRRATSKQMFSAEACLTIIVGALASGLRRAYAKIFHHKSAQPPTSSSAEDPTLAQQRAELPQKFETLLCLALLCIGPVAPRVVRSEAFHMLSNLVYIAVATGAADDTVDLDISVAGAYPGQHRFTLDAFSSRSMGNFPMAVSMPGGFGTPQQSPVTFDQQTEGEGFPVLVEDDLRLQNFRLVLHHMHRLAVKSESVAPAVAERLAREACRVLALVLRNRAPQFLTEYFRRVQTFPFLRGQYLTWGLRVVLPWCESAAQRIKGVHVTTSSGDFESTAGVVSPGRAVHLRNFTMDREIPLHADTVAELEVQIKQAQGHALALEPFWLMSCAILEQQRNFVPPRELIQVWVVLAQVRTVSLVDANGSLAVLRYVMNKVAAVGATVAGGGNATASSPQNPEFVPSHAIVCRLAREIMTAIGVALFPQAPSIVMGILVEPLQFNYRSKAQTEAAGGMKEAEPSSWADQSTVHGKFSRWYHLLLQVHPIGMEHILPHSSASVGLGDLSGMSSSTPLNSSLDASFQPQTIPEDDETGHDIHHGVEDDESVHEDRRVSGGNDQSNVPAVKALSQAAAAKLPTSSGEEWRENTCLRSTVASVLAEMIVIIPEPLFREHLATLSTFCIVSIARDDNVQPGFRDCYAPMRSTHAEERLLLVMLRRLAINALDHLQLHRQSLGVLSQNRELMRLLDAMLLSFCTTDLDRERKGMHYRMTAIMKLELFISSLDIIIAQAPCLHLTFQRDQTFREAADRTMAWGAAARASKLPRRKERKVPTVGFEISVSTVVDAVVLLAHLQDTDYRIALVWVETLCEWIATTRRCPALQVPCTRLLGRVHRATLLYPATSTISEQNFFTRAEALFLQALLVQETLAVSQNDHGARAERVQSVDDGRYAVIDSLAHACQAIVDVWVQKSQMWDVSSFVLNNKTARSRVRDNKKTRRHNRHNSGIPGSGVDARCFVAYFWTTVALIHHHALDNQPASLQQLARSMLTHVFRSERLRTLLDERESLDSTLWDYAKISPQTTLQGLEALLGHPNASSTNANSTNASPEKLNISGHSRSSTGSGSFSSGDSRNCAEDVWTIASFSAPRWKPVPLSATAGLFVSCVDHALRKLSTCLCHTPDIEMLLLSGRIVNNKLAGAPSVLLRRILLTTIFLPLMGSLECKCPMPASMRDHAHRFGGNLATSRRNSRHSMSMDRVWGGLSSPGTEHVGERRGNSFSEQLGQSGVEDPTVHRVSVTDHGPPRRSSSTFSDLGVDLGTPGHIRRKSGSLSALLSPGTSSAPIPREKVLLSILVDYFSEESLSVAFDLGRILQRCQAYFFPTNNEDDADPTNLHGIGSRKMSPRHYQSVRGHVKDFGPWLEMFSKCIGQHYPQAVAPCIRVLLTHVRNVCNLDCEFNSNPTAIDTRGALAIRMISSMVEAFQKRKDYDAEMISGAIHDMLEIFSEILHPSEKSAAAGHVDATYSSRLLQTYETVVHSIASSWLAPWHPLRNDSPPARRLSKFAPTASLFSFSTTAQDDDSRDTVPQSSSSAPPLGWRSPLDRIPLDLRFSNIFATEVLLLRRFDDMGDILPNSTETSNISDSISSPALIGSDSDSLAFLRSSPDNSGSGSSSSSSSGSDSASGSDSSSDSDSIRLPMEYGTVDASSLHFAHEDDFPLPTNSDAEADKTKEGLSSTEPDDPTGSEMLASDISNADVSAAEPSNENAATDESLVDDNVSHPSSTELVGHQVMLEDVLADSECESILYDFMDANDDTCMLEFYKAVNEYEEMFQCDPKWEQGDMGPARRRAQAIVKRFVNLDAFDTIDDLDEGVRSEIIEAVSSSNISREQLVRCSMYNRVDLLLCVAFILCYVVFVGKRVCDGQGMRVKHDRVRCVPSICSEQ